MATPGHARSAWGGWSYDGRVARGVVVAIVLACVGCAGGLTARGAVTYPARVPVRAFPHIVLTTRAGEEAEVVAERLAAHLRDGPSTVRRMRVEELEARRAAGAIAPATGVLSIQLRLTRGDRPEWARREELSCGPDGVCLDTRRPVLESTPVVNARLVLRVSDGQSGRELQREVLAEEEVGEDVLGMRLRVVERLVARAERLIDQRTEPVEVRLEEVDAPEVRAALDAIRGGDWTRGRERLEAVVEQPTFARQPAEVRARVLYDLGQARRFDTTIAAERRFALAGEAMRAAVRLRPESRYAAALAALAAHRRSRAMVIEQAEATAHNSRSPAADQSANAPQSVPAADAEGGVEVITVVPTWWLVT